MKTIYKSDSRGLTRIDWLTSFHSFSFGNYFDRKRVNFGPLRVLNDDIIEPGGGFPAHPHKNMEIITLVLEGELSHADSTGKTETIRYGEIQKMSAGSGILHSEFNNSTSEKVHLLQIWIIPDKNDLKPSYEKILFTPEQIKDTLFKIGGKEENNTVLINQDAELFFSDFSRNKTLRYPISSGRGIFIHLIDGKIQIDDDTLENGDAAGVENSEEINLNFVEPSRFLLFDMAL